MGHAQFLRNLENVQIGIPVLEGRGARGNQQVWRACQGIEDFLGQAVGEPALVLLLAEIGKGQHGDGLGFLDLRNGRLLGRRR